jgi:hypothetical protein
VKLDCFWVLLKYNILVDCECEIGLFWVVIEVKYYLGVCVCEIGLFWGLLKYNIIVECVCVKLDCFGGY